MAYVDSWPLIYWRVIDIFWTCNWYFLNCWMSSPTVSRFFNHAVLVVTANISVKTSAFPPAHLLSASVSLHVGRSEAWHKCKCLLKQIPFFASLRAAKYGSASFCPFSHVPMTSELMWLFKYCFTYKATSRKHLVCKPWKLGFGLT